MTGETIVIAVTAEMFVTAVMIVNHSTTVIM